MVVDVGAILSQITPILTTMISLMMTFYVLRMVFSLFGALPRMF